MLSREQLLHFAEHGWVLVEGVLSEEQCAVYRTTLDRLAATRLPVGDQPVFDDLTTIDNLLLYDDVFLGWLKQPGVLEAQRQIVGARIHLQSTVAHIRVPHPERRERAEELSDPDGWRWHRGLRPKWGIFPYDHDPELLNCTMVHNITYLTPVEPRNGSTALLDGSHLLEGGYQSLKGRCPVVESPARPGDMLAFSETTVHSGVPILSERTRYNIYYAFTPAWYAEWPGYCPPQELVERLRDEELCDLLKTCNYSGQYSPLQEPPAGSMPPSA